MRSPDGKSQRGDDGGKGFGSSGNDEETEDGSKKGHRARTMVEGYKMLHAGGDGRSNGVGIIVDVEISKEVVTSGEMAGDDHCSMDDDPPTDGICHLRLRTPDG